MCIKFIHYKDDLWGIGAHHIGHVFYLVCPVYCCTMLMHANVMPASKGGSTKAKILLVPFRIYSESTFLLSPGLIAHDSLASPKS